MPAPKVLSFLPKPLLFALYGAVGGLLGALVFGELVWAILAPKKAEAALPPPPEPRLALVERHRQRALDRGSDRIDIIRIDQQGRLALHGRASEAR